jgi:hypothetical protein
VANCCERCVSDFELQDQSNGRDVTPVPGEWDDANIHLLAEEGRSDPPQLPSLGKAGSLKWNLVSSGASLLSRNVKK